MLTLEMFLNELSNTFCVIKNQNNVVIYPSCMDEIQKKNYDIIKKLAFSGKKQIEIGNNWFEYTEQKIINGKEVYYIQILRDITNYKEREIQAETDYVTGLYSKRLSLEMFDEYITEAMEKGKEFACVMGDADLFKQINDTYGHICGDEVLKYISDLIHQNTRQNIDNSVLRTFDIVGRMGGEEFLIVLKDISEKESIDKIENIRQIIENSTINFEEQKIKICTLSFGLYHVTKDELETYKDLEIDEIRSLILKKSDKALYYAKENGRNQIFVTPNSKKEPYLRKIKLPK